MPVGWGAGSAEGAVAGTVCREISTSASGGDGGTASGTSSFSTIGVVRALPLTMASMSSIASGMPVPLLGGPWGGLIGADEISSGAVAGWVVATDASTWASASASAGVASSATVPAKGSGRSPDSQTRAGARRSSVKLCDQPLSLLMVARQIALPSGVGCNMPWSWSTLKTAVLFAGMPSIPCDSRCARSLSETVLLTSHKASSVSQPSEASG